MSQEHHIPFDRGLLRRRRERAATRRGEHDFLFQETARQLIDRLLDTTRTFPMALELGCGGEVVAALSAAPTEDQRIGWLAGCDLAHGLVRRARGGQQWREAAFLVADEEFLPFADTCFDLVCGNLTLHWVNDLPGVLARIRRMLRPGGLFLAAMPGENTLAGLRDCLIRAELDLRGGAGPRVAPMVDVRTAGMLLQRAGFTLPVVDRESVRVTYDALDGLLADLRGMGEASILNGRDRSMTPKSLFRQAGRLYGAEATDDAGRITAEFDILFLHGWAPDG